MMDPKFAGRHDCERQIDRLVARRKPNSGQQSPHEFSFVVPGRPQPKGRPRMSRKGRVYTPKETVLKRRKHTLEAVDDRPAGL